MQQCKVSFTMVTLPIDLTIIHLCRDLRDVRCCVLRKTTFGPSRAGEFTNRKRSGKTENIEDIEVSIWSHLRRMNRSSGGDGAGKKGRAGRRTFSIAKASIISRYQKKTKLQQKSLDSCWYHCQFPPGKGPIFRCN